MSLLDLNLDKLWKVWQQVVEKEINGIASPWFDSKPQDLNSARHTKFDKTLSKVNDPDYRNPIILRADGSIHSADIKGEWEEFMHDEMSEVVEWLEAMSGIIYGGQDLWEEIIRCRIPL